MISCDCRYTPGGLSQLIYQIKAANWFDYPVLRQKMCIGDVTVLSSELCFLG